MTVQFETNTTAIISSYTPRQALEDGVYIDPATRLGENLAGEIGLTIPVYFTAGVVGDLVAVPEVADWQDEKGRAWDIFTMLRFCLMRNRGESVARFVVHATRADAKDWAPRDHRLVAELVEDPEIGAFIVVMWPGER